ncbi:SIR2 family protein [Actinophytocola glycyrrhizae]|uniref:SIR2 family protein n=1 Tax=Actinophytocola glycyrrhizae TaxID=2044873 RepID=A0ABV9SIW4_9PSEU
MVVLCGSGVSTVSPSSVPSWYRLNAAVLDGLRELAVTHVLTSTPSRTAAASLRPDDVPLVTFSQVLSDAFAGRHWLGVLTVLDDDNTNGVHRALAALIGEGRCHAVITTNFDTLIERACEQAGLEVPEVVPAVVPVVPVVPERPAVYKIHGSVRWPETMVDLLLDKQRGLRPSTRRSLAAACRDRHLVVLGFSGEDFAMDYDYFGLVAHGALPHRVTWIVRPGSEPSVGARAFLDALTFRGVEVAVECLRLEELAGTVPSGDETAADTSDLRLTSHVRDWLSGGRVSPPVAALVVAVLLRLRGQTDEAAAARAEIRLALHRFEDGPVQMISAAAAWALLGKEERIHSLALDDLRRAEEALDRFDRFAAAQKVSFHGQAVVEQRLLRAAVRQNAAIAWLSMGDLEKADRFLADAQRVLAEVPGAEAVRRVAGIRCRQALHALVRGDLSHAMIALENSIECATRCGDGDQETWSALLLAMCLRASGEDELAAVLDQRAGRLGVTATDARWRERFEGLVRDGAPVSDLFGDVIAAITPDPLLSDVVAARATGDPARTASALLTAVQRDVRQHHGERLGQLLLALDLAGDRSPTSLYQRTVRALCATNLPELPARGRFLLKVTELGLNLSDGQTMLPADVIDEMLTIGRAFDYQPCVFVPYGYDEGLRTLARNAAQAGNDAFRRRDLERAEALYHLGYCGLWQSSDHEHATAAALYRCDALIALDRYRDAAACLERVREFATTHFPFDYLVRHVEILAWLALRTESARWTDNAAAVAELAISVAERTPRNAKRALLNAAINLQRLNEPDLARQLLDRVDITTLTSDEADTLAALTKALTDTTTGLTDTCATPPR